MPALGAGAAPALPIMWPLALVLTATIAALGLRRTRWAVPALRVSRWTYALFVVFGLLYFPLRGGRLTAPECQWTFDLALARHSLTNYPHMILLGVFFLITYAQLPNVPRALLWSGVACMAMGLLVELSQGMSGHGHCRMRDLIPDAVGALAGLLVVVTGRRLWRLRS